MTATGQNTAVSPQQELVELRRRVQSLEAEVTRLKQENASLLVLQNLIRQLPVGVQVFSADGLCIDTNEAHLRIFGVEDRDQIVGQYNIFADPLAEEVGTAPAARRALETGQVVNLPEVHFDLRRGDPRFCRPEGEKYLSVSFIPIRNAEGNPTQLVALNQDITAQKQIEAELRAGEERFRQVIASISDHIYVTEVTADGRRINLYLSPHVEAMTGYPYENFLNDWRFWPEHVIHPDDRAAAAGQAEKLARGEDSEIEYRLVRSDGAVIWVRDRARVKKQNGSLIIFGLVSDITEHKLVELEREWLTSELRDVNQTLDERVRARTAELQAILDAVGEGIVVTNLEGEIQYVNPALERLTGYTEAEALGRKPHIWKSGKHPPTVYQQLWQTILAGQTWRGELVNRRKNGQLYDVLLTVTPIPGPSGQPVGFVGVQNDITPLKEMDRLKSEFISTAAHELRTPLTSIQGFSEILLTRPDLDEARKNRYLTFINQQAQTLAAIISDLLDLSRLEAKKSFELTQDLVDLKQIAEEVMFAFQENNPAHQYIVKGPENWPKIQGDPLKLAQLLKNLVSNATKYSPDGGKINLRLDIVPEYRLVHLTISDEGIGMTPEQLNKVFDRFYRADASNTAIGGTGLGMSISRLIVQRHGGQIWVESEYGVGTTVHVLLPLPNRPEYVLVIEDDSVLREVQQRGLELQGYRVLTAADGRTGLELARQGLPDLILLDLSLPEMTGFEILEKLKSAHYSADIPIIITSAMDKRQEIELAMTKGVVDYLVKPYSINDLLMRVRRALLSAHQESVSAS
ncbi:MAG: PAS domain S-box protein [Chloroflexi bacterium]|nr:MAG: PAS domain S-box protein [Chloroflexota bacterium]